MLPKDDDVFPFYDYMPNCLVDSAKSKRKYSRQEVINRCLTALYENAENVFGEKGNFMELVEQAPVDKFGRSFFPVYDYFLDINRTNQIIKRYLRYVPHYDRLYVESYIRQLCPTSNGYLFNRKRLYDETMPEVLRSED